MMNMRTLNRYNHEYTPKCMCNILNGALNAIGAIGGAAIQNAGAKKRNQEMMDFEREEAATQREWNEAMMDKQNAWNYEMWQEQNEYNSPVEQYKRLREAGLNPLSYGLDGTGNAGQLSSAEALGYQRASAPNLENPGAAFGNMAMQIAQIANIQADTAKKGEETITEVQRREKMIADIATAKQELQNKLAEEGLTKAKKDEILKGIEWMDRLNQATLEEKQASAALDKATKKRIEELLEGEKLIQSKTIEDFNHKWAKISAEINKISKEAGLLDKDIENYALNHASNGVMGSGISVQNLMRLILGNTGNENTEKGKEQRQRNGDAAGMIYDNK